MVLKLELSRRILAGQDSTGGYSQDCICNALETVRISKNAIWTLQRTSHLSKAHEFCPTRAPWRICDGLLERYICLFTNL